MQGVITKIDKELLRKKLLLAKKIDAIRKKHKVKLGEKNSEEIIRYFRDTRYSKV